MFIFIVEIVYKSLDCPQCKKMDPTSNCTYSQGINRGQKLYAEHAKHVKFWRVFLKTSKQFNALVSKIVPGGHILVPTI